MDAAPPASLLPGASSTVTTTELPLGVLPPLPLQLLALLPLTPAPPPPASSPLPPLVLLLQVLHALLLALPPVLWSFSATRCLGCGQGDVKEGPATGAACSAGCAGVIC